MRTAGRPLVNTTSCRFPSLGAGLATQGGSGDGPGLCGPAAVGMPPASDPPAFGLLSWYWACSSRVTAQFRWWSRPHSASRWAGGVVVVALAVVGYSVAGAVSYTHLTLPTNRE